MSDMLENLQKHFQTSIRYAFRNVFSNFKSNICVLAVILILQAMLSVIVLVYQDNSQKNLEITYDNYDWHAVLLKCSRQDTSMLIDFQWLYGMRMYPCGYEIVRIEVVETSNELNSEKYDIYLKFTGETLIRGYYVFRQQMNDRKWNVQLSPLYYFEAEYTLADFHYFLMDEANNLVLSVKQGTGTPDILNFMSEYVPFFQKHTLGLTSDNIDIDSGVFLVSLVIWVLFSHTIFRQTLRSKISLDKYTYGIFKVFGGDMKKQRSIIRYEIICIWLVALIPAYFTGYILYSLMYGNHTLSFSDICNSVIATAFISLILLMLTLKRPVDGIVKESCVNLLKTSDTTEYVSSPRRSFNIMTSKYPWIQSLIAGWRMRRYFISLILTLTVLLSLSICSMSLADSYEKNLSYEKPQWTMALNDHYDIENIVSGVKKISGIERAEINEYNEIKLYAEKNLKFEEYEYTSRQIRQWIYKSGYNITFINHNTNWIMHVLQTTQYQKCFRLVGIMVFIMIPVVCIYTQANYYFRKKKEYQLYTVVGVDQNHIDKYLRNDGIFLFFVTLPISIAVTSACYFAVKLITGILELDFRLNVFNMTSFILGTDLLLVLILVSPTVSNKFQMKFFNVSLRSGRRREIK